MTATTRTIQATESTPTLYLAFELGEEPWRLGFTTGFGEKVLHDRVAAREAKAILRAIERAKRRLGVPDSAPVVSCYEAGREGFWLHRFLTAHGVENLVVDSSSIEVNRRRRRAKTDRLDLEGLLDLLLRHRAGSRKKVWSVVRVPTIEEEDRRHLHSRGRVRASSTTPSTSMSHTRGLSRRRLGGVHLGSIGTMSNRSSILRALAAAALELTPHAFASSPGVQ